MADARQGIILQTIFARAAMIKGVDRIRSRVLIRWPRRKFLCALQSVPCVAAAAAGAKYLVLTARVLLPCRINIEGVVFG